jgi:hypothetical protein
MIFYAIYKKQPKHFYYLSFQLQGGPRKELLFRNVVPGRAGRRGSPELSHSGEGFAWGMGGEGRGGHLRPVCGRSSVSNRPAAPRRPGRGAPLSAGAPAWERRRGWLGSTARMLVRLWEGRGTEARRELPGRTAASAQARTAGCVGLRRAAAA